MIKQSIDAAQLTLALLHFRDFTDTRNRSTEEWRPSPENLAKLIEHTKLSADTEPMPGSTEISKLCAEARSHAFLGVCVNRPHIAQAKSELAGSSCKVVTVIDFPVGSSPSREKARQVQEAAGADELDMVIAVEALKSGSFREVYDDIRAVVEAAGDRAVKVILETGKLTDDQIVHSCLICRQAGARFVKTSTGKGPRGASIADIRIMSQCVGDSLGIKAAGGVSTYLFARDLVLAGATRVGSSKSIDLISARQDSSL